VRKVRSPQLYLLAKSEIFNYIQENSLSFGSLLPPERYFMDKLGISRGTLREAMNILEEDGVIRRKQGLGTLVCDTENLIRSTLDINESVSEMLIGKGMKPGSKSMEIKKIQANRDLAEKLNLNCGDPVISLIRIRTANKIPVAYTINSLPLGIAQETFPQDFKGGSLYTYLEEKLGIGVTNSMIEIKPIKAPRSIARSLDIKQGALLMLLKQTDTSNSNVPIIYSEEYFVADRFEFTVYRKRKRKRSSRHL